MQGESHNGAERDIILIITITMTIAIMTVIIRVTITTTDNTNVTTIKIIVVIIIMGIIIGCDACQCIPLRCVPVRLGASRCLLMRPDAPPGASVCVPVLNGTS